LGDKLIPPRFAARDFFEELLDRFLEDRFEERELPRAVEGDFFFATDLPPLARIIAHVTVQHVLKYGYVIAYFVRLAAANSLSQRRRPA
jgi:hypothetical protein